MLVRLMYASRATDARRPEVLNAILRTRRATTRASA